MPLVVVGLNHKTAPIGLLERLAISEEMLPKALHQLSTYKHVLEGVVLSTCNRIEVYANVSKFHGGAQDLRNFLAEFCHVSPEDFTDRLYTYHDEAAARHLLRVASGIDSMVVGESEVLGQVRRAYRLAADENMVNGLLGKVFGQAVRVGKRARTETAIGRNPVSISSAAVELARRAFEGRTLSGKRVVIVGAGKMGRLALQALGGAGVTDVTVVNRSEERAHELASTFGAQPLPFERLPEAMGGADIVICSTMSPQVIIGRSLVERVVADRHIDRPLFIVDIAVPRDVEASVAGLDKVVLRDIDDLRGVVDASIGGRLGEVSRVEEIIAGEVERFVEWERSSEYAPTAAALVARADAIRRSELDRFEGRLSELSQSEREAVEHVTRSIIAKLLHTPLKRAKTVGPTAQGQAQLAALRELFELDEWPESEDS